MRRVDLWNGLQIGQRSKAAPATTAAKKLGSWHLTSNRDAVWCPSTDGIAEAFPVVRADRDCGLFGMHPAAFLQALPARLLHRAGRGEERKRQHDANAGIETNQGQIAK